MKVSRIIFASLLLCFFGIGFAHSQDNSKKDKSKDNKSGSKFVEVKANLMVLEADGKFADIKLEDLKIYEDGVEQKIEYVTKKENALNIGFVMDNTGSMRSYLERIAAAGATLVNNLRQQDEAFVVRFVSSDKVEIFQDWTSNKKLLNDGLANMFIEGGRSAVIDGIYLSAEVVKKREKVDHSTRTALILITDGDDRDSYFNRRQLFDLLKGSDMQIFVIGLVGELAFESLQKNSVKFINQLALETGGAAFVLKGKSKKIETELVESIKAILTELNSQYVVGYTSTNQKRDGLARKLTVQIADGAKGEKRQAFIRESFVVPEEKIK